MSEELKPCPFCGSDPYIGEFSTGWHAECPNDECTHKPDLWDMFHMKDQAIKAWNTRHIPEGYKLVPVEPTVEMEMAGDKAMIEKGPWSTFAYKAMIETAE